MISLQGLADNLVPSVYIKNLTLNSMYGGLTTKTTYNGEGFYDPEMSKETSVGVQSTSSSKMIISMKFVDNASFKTDMIQLLTDGTGLGENITIYIYQVTDQQTYQHLILSKKKTLLALPAATAGEDTVKLKKINFKDIPNWNLDTVKESPGAFGPLGANTYRLPEQLLEDGTRLVEAIVDVTFSFENKTNFLAYVIVCAITHPDLDQPLMGKTTAEIVILNGVLQQEALVFTIAPIPSNVNSSLLLPFGKPGDVWTGGVHMIHEPNTPIRFMAGDEHTTKPHPYLDYKIVPNHKFVDNRIGTKVERKITNATKEFEILNSLTTRYRDSAVNLLDYSSYKKLPYISDIYLSQDQYLNINGFLTVDKINLIKSSCAFPFLFDNIAAVFGNNPQGTIILNKLLARAPLQLLSVYENGKLLGNLTQYIPVQTITYENAPPQQYSPEGFSAGQPGMGSGEQPIPEKIPYFSLQKQDITYALGTKMSKGSALGVESFCFKKQNANTAEYEYRVTVSYEDPTISYVQRLTNLVAKAGNDLQTLLVYLQSLKSPQGFNPITQQIAPQTLKDIYEKQPIDIALAQAGFIPSAIVNLLADHSFMVYFYSPGVSEHEFKSYIRTIATLDSTTLASMLVLETFLQHLVNRLESSLNSFGSAQMSGGGTGTDNQYGTAKTKGDVNSSREARYIQAESKAKIAVTDRGYDFTGFMVRTWQSFPKIFIGDYKKGCLQAFYNLVPKVKQEPATVQLAFTPKGLSKQKVVNSIYTFLSIPISFLKHCIMLPPTVMNKHILPAKEITTLMLENVFINIKKLNDSLLENTSGGTSTAITGRQIYRENLDTVLGQSYGTALPEVLLMKDTSTSEMEAKEKEFKEKSSSAASSKKDADAGWGTGTGAGVNPVPKPYNTGGTTDEDIYSSPQKNFSYTATYSQQQNQNFILASMLNKLLIDQKKSWRVPMGKKGFLPYAAAGTIGWEGITSFMLSNGGPYPPLQVTSLSIDEDNMSIFKKFATGNQTYINQNVINPLLLCYYWFVHQNIVKIEYIKQYTVTENTVSIVDEDNPYSAGKTQTISTRNIKKPEWSALTADVLEAWGLSPFQKLFCRLTRYEYPFYIDKHLVKELNLPLVNNYFILQSPELSGADIAAAAAVVAADVDVSGLPKKVLKPGPA